jgi:hypothetical protein
MRFGPDDDASGIAFEVSTRDRANCWMRVRGTITNRWSGKRRDIDDEISLATVRHPGGGRRWCFVCPAQGWLVRKLWSLRSNTPQFVPKHSKTVNQVG